MADNSFVSLAKVDVSKYVEKKNGLSYLSWAWAVAKLMEHDPQSNWEFHAPTMFGDTMMVSCTVTAFGKPITMHLPVMDHKNKAIPNPGAFEVNKNMMRCLVKAIACHGLGLSLYAGEDLPIVEPEKLTAEQIAKVQSALNDANLSAMDVCKVAKVNSLKEIDQERFDGLMKWINDQAKEEA